MHLDPVEKKPLYHFFPGQQIFSVGTFGCNLFCKGCQNFDISRAKVENFISKLNYIGPEDTLSKAKASGAKMIAYTYNEPTIFFEYMIDISKMAKKKGLKNVIVSNGYINPEPLKELIKFIDAANIDIKFFDDKKYKEYSNAKLEPVLETIKTLAKSKVWLELTNLIIPGINDDLAEVKKMCEWIASIDSGIPLHFSRFFPYYKADDKDITPIQTLIEAKKIALNAGLKYVYIGNIGEVDNTYCSKCHNLLIERPHYEGIIVGLIGAKKNKCEKCGKILDGMF